MVGNGADARGPAAATQSPAIWSELRAIRRDVAELVEHVRGRAKPLLAEQRVHAAPAASPDQLLRGRKPRPHCAGASLTKHPLPALPRGYHSRPIQFSRTKTAAFTARGRFDLFL